MRENRPYGSEGRGSDAPPDPHRFRAWKFLDSRLRGNDGSGSMLSLMVL